MTSKIKTHEARGTYTVAEALADHLNLIWFPLYNYYRLPSQKRYAKACRCETMDLTNTAYIGAVANLQKLPPEQEINRSFIIASGSMYERRERSNMERRSRPGAKCAKLYKKLSNAAPIEYDDAEGETRDILDRALICHPVEIEEGFGAKARDFMHGIYTALIIPSSLFESLDVVFLDGKSGRETAESSGASYAALIKYIRKVKRYCNERFTVQQFRENLY